jgi:alkanesulfonate monooxygenase SsuD/methylene tetrahydromethanopterin reductase-like flavin-dependent oxidoreductase (luciferase family)
MPDHFEDQYAPVPALMAAAAATTTLRVGTLVFDNDYKHPVVLAKEAATLDVLSGGRLEFGIGAGWMTSDYEQAGMTYDAPGERIARLKEGLAVMKGLWADEPVAFDGSTTRAHAACRSQHSGRTRRSSSAVAASACSSTPRARRTSSASISCWPMEWSTAR